MDINEISIVGMDGSVRYKGNTLHTKNRAGDVYYAGEPLTLDRLRSFLTPDCTLKRKGSTKYHNGIIIVERNGNTVTVDFDEVFSVRSHKGTTKSKLQMPETVQRWEAHFHNAFLRFMPQTLVKEETYSLTLTQYKMMQYHLSDWNPKTVAEIQAKETVLLTLAQIKYASSTAKE